MKKTTFQVIIACILLIIISSTMSCKTRTITQTKIVEVPKITVEYRDKFVKDSTVELDSTFMEVDRDTVFKTRFKTKFRYIAKVDSFLKTDTITKVAEVQVQVPVEKKLSWWQKTEMYGFRILSTLLILFLILFFGYKYMKRFMWF